MELKITNKITNCIKNDINREVSKLKCKWSYYTIKYHLWKIRFNIDTLPIRIALNPKMIKIKVEGRLNKVYWKIRNFKIDFKYFIKRTRRQFSRYIIKLFNLN